MADLDFIAAISSNAHQFELGEAGEEVNGPQPIGACSSPLIGSGRSILSSYIFPPETWLFLTTKQRRENWVTPRIPPTVSLKCWASLTVPRIAYVSEPNWEKRGARGLFGITQMGTGHFGIDFVIGHPISPSLYNYVNQSLGESGANFAIMGRNTYWMSAAIGGFREDSVNGGEFLVHYNDDGKVYKRLRLPYHTLVEYVRRFAPEDIVQVAWPDETVPEPHGNKVLGDTRLLVGRDDQTSTGIVPNRVHPLTTPGALEPGTSHEAPLINEGFYKVDLARFWPQFMIALEIALYSPVASRDLLNMLGLKEHWMVIDTYMAENRGKWRWVPPTYAVGNPVGRATRPDYLS